MAASLGEWGAPLTFPVATTPPRLSSGRSATRAARPKFDRFVEHESEVELPNTLLPSREQLNSIVEVTERFLELLRDAALLDGEVSPPVPEPTIAYRRSQVAYRWLDWEKALIKGLPDVATGGWQEWRKLHYALVDLSSLRKTLTTMWGLEPVVAAMSIRCGVEATGEPGSGVKARFLLARMPPVAGEAREVRLEKAVGWPPPLPAGWGGQCSYALEQIKEVMRREKAGIATTPDCGTAAAPKAAPGGPNSDSQRPEPPPNLARPRHLALGVLMWVVPLLDDFLVPQPAPRCAHALGLLGSLVNAYVKKRYDMDTALAAYAEVSRQPVALAGKHGTSATDWAIQYACHVVVAFTLESKVALLHSGALPEADKVALEAQWPHLRHLILSRTVRLPARQDLERLTAEVEWEYAQVRRRQQEETGAVGPCVTEGAPSVAAGATSPAPPHPTEAMKIDLEAQALALLFRHPNWKVQQIADHLGVDRKTLYKWADFRAAAELLGRLTPRGRKGPAPRRGHKSKDGMVEAYQDEEPDE